ncbi:MAG: LysM peptidoglycan-binding domain-containing protein [Deltaproteobacteria bacterium]|nr:LysM peptidoglycan-binding domain-containing protein [Deltaproteobacteria bacterium]MBW2640041.1 LysM peptidoglycan-binding domain-containing protein [Deltaproteobacteria bacterium]MBW2679214.1 LysM peptidoglycan-binding domain-containing protein [Deltaproteobacteria bacterium]
MDHKNSDLTGQENSEPEQNDFYEQEYLQWDKKKKKKFGSGVFNLPETIPLSWVGVFFLIFIVMLILALGGILGKLSGFENRLIKLEEQIVRFQDIDDKLTLALEQPQALEQFKDRFDRLEASMSLRMDHLVTGMNNLQKDIAQVKAQKTQAVKPAAVVKKTPKKRYHTVRPGDTLYNIARKYGVTVKKIRALNKLSDRAVIHPGQKLIVGP